MKNQYKMQTTEAISNLKVLVTWPATNDEADFIAIMIYFKSFMPIVSKEETVFQFCISVDLYYC